MANRSGATWSDRWPADAGHVDDVQAMRQLTSANVTGNVDQQLGLTRERERAGGTGRAGRSKAGERLTGFFGVSRVCSIPTIVLRPRESDIQIPLQMECSYATATDTASGRNFIYEALKEKLHNNTTMETVVSR
jgi:hypothetical protein